MNNITILVVVVLLLVIHNNSFKLVASQQSVSSNVPTVVIVRGVQVQPCEICEFVISQMDQILEDNAGLVLEEIRKAFERTCNYLPKKVRGNCNTFVDEYSDSAINYLAEFLDPFQVCFAIGMCQRTEPGTV